MKKSNSFGDMRDLYGYALAIVIYTLLLFIKT